VSNDYVSFPLSDKYFSEAHRVHDAIHPVPAAHVTPSAGFLRESAA